MLSSTSRWAPIMEFDINHCGRESDLLFCLFASAGALSCLASDMRVLVRLHDVFPYGKGLSKISLLVMVL